MAGILPTKNNNIAQKRRERKKRFDVLNNTKFKHEVNHVFNTFYKNQVSALYREMMRKKS